MAMYWLSANSISFPDPDRANADGILAIGGDLSIERLLAAYRLGVFPWYNETDPILWWSPDPRFVVFPSELKVSKSMRPYFNQKKFSVTMDQSFRRVITACRSKKRKGQGGASWLTDEMIEAYCQLHEAGYAHSVEVWQNKKLAGGLYGISLGKIFYGESMFSYVSNASKFGFISLVQCLQKLKFRLIDCQQETGHLESLGGRAIPRSSFLKYMKENTAEKTIKGDWNKLLLNLKI